MHSGIAHAGMSVGILGILGMPLTLNNKFAIKLINTLNIFTRSKCERLYNEAVFEGGYEEIHQEH
jgi:hypothetical protein